LQAFLGQKVPFPAADAALRNPAGFLPS
jgi:hypothetical protein